MLHQEDMIRAFKLAIDCRESLPPDAQILIGEEEAPGYDELQDALGRLIHGDEEWTTLSVPKSVADSSAQRSRAAISNNPSVPWASKRPIGNSRLRRFAERY
jgi:hypothetical protein